MTSADAAVVSFFFIGGLLLVERGDVTQNVDLTPGKRVCRWSNVFEDRLSRKILCHARFHVTYDFISCKISRFVRFDEGMSRKISRHLRFHVT